MAGRDVQFGIRIRADKSGFVNETRDAGRAVKDFGDTASSAAVTAARLGTVLGAAAVGGVALLTRSVIQSIKAMDDLDEAAKNVGIAAETLSSMELSAQAAGVSSGQFTQAVTKLNRTMVEATGGNERAATAFRALGVQLVDSNGRMRDTDQVLREVSDRFRQYADGAEKSALAQELFGRGGARLIAFLNEGSDGLTKFAGASREQIAEAAKLTAEVDKLSASWERLKLAIGGTVAGGVNRAIAAVGSESENAPEKVLERLEQGIERVRTQMRSQRNPSFLEADQLRLQDMLATAQQLRATIEGARSGGDDARLTGGVGAAPNIGALERARKQREKNEEDARKAAERASREAVKRAEEQARELERLSAASTAATLKSVAALASEAEALEKVNRQLAENNAEIGLSRFEVDELQASRIDDAVAVREQELAMARLAEASEGEIALMQRQIEALREQASLRRAGSQATQAEQTRSEVTESSRRALEEQKRTAEEVGSILSRSISNAMDDGTGFFRQFADDFGRYLRDKMIQALSDQLVQQLLAQLAGGGNSSGYGDGVGDLFISLFGLHSGGIVGSEASFSRPVSARALRGAPRYHRGGIAGDERVAILRTGEGVFTPEQMSRLSPAGGGITVNIENRTDAQVSARQGDDGMSIEVLIERIDERLASNVSTGRGALSNAVQNRFGLRTQAL